MKLKYDIMVNVVIHISKLKRMTGMTTKQHKVKIKRVNEGNKFYDSSPLFIPWGFKIPGKSIN